MKRLGDLIKHWLSDGDRQQQNIVLSCNHVVAETDFSDPEIYEAPETKSLVRLVNNAVQLIEEKGEAAFAELRQPPWYVGESYVFVVDLQGTGRVNPPVPAMEGKNGLELKDSWGTAMIKQYLKDLTICNRKSTWVHYFGINPTNEQEEWKSSFVMKAMGADGTGYAVGSGVYNMKMERVLVGNDLKDTCELIEQQGLAAWSQLKTQKYFQDTQLLFDRLNLTPHSPAEDDFREEEKMQR